MPTSDELLERDLNQLLVALHAAANHDLLLAIRRAQLTLERVELLDFLRRTPVAPDVHSCADAMHLQQNSASQLIKDMVARGLVKRTVDEHDARVRRVEITQEGEQVLVSLHAARRPTIRAFIQKQNDRCRQRLRAAIEEAIAGAAA